MKKPLNDTKKEKTMDDVCEMLICTERGTPKSNQTNFITVLTNDPFLKGVICKNELTDRTDIRGDLGWTRQSAALNDDDLAHIKYYMGSNYELNNDKELQAAIRVIADNNRYHPIREHLESLEWDGTPRLSEALNYFFGVEITPLYTAMLEVFIFGCIERIYHPGCKFDTMLCLVGGQGCGKSTFFRFMALDDNWFTDDIKNLSDENVFRKLQGHMIIEFSEMVATTSAKSVEIIKSFISRQIDTYKVPYDRHPKDRPRQCVFGGTSNNKRFLPHDVTGNRRFLPVEVNAANAKVHILDDEEHSRHYISQLYAEAMVRYKKGDYYLAIPKHLEPELEQLRAEFMAEDTDVGIIQNFLDSYGGTHVCTLLVHEDILRNAGRPDRKQVNLINDIMNHQIKGWIPGPNHRFERYGVQRSWVREDYNKELKPEEGFVTMDEAQMKLPFL